MMIDFALEAEREQGKSPREAIHQACLLRFRPDHDDHDGGAAGRAAAGARAAGPAPSCAGRSGITIVGGLLLSQVLTLFTTPVIYLYMERLAARLRPRRRPDARDARSGRRGGERRREHLRAVRPPADRDVAAGGGGAAVGPGRRTAACRSRRCRASTSRPSTSARRCPGASPETMASSVATPLERRFGRIAGLTEMTSVSSLGSTSITLQFDLDRDVTGAARDVQAAINAAGAELPANLPTRPNYRKVNPADSPILILVADLGRRCRWRRCSTPPTACSPRRSRRSRASGRCSSAAASSRRCACRSIRRCWPGADLSLEDVRAALAVVDGEPAQGDRSAAPTSATTSPRTISCSGADAYRQLVVSYQNGAGRAARATWRDVFDDVENNRLAAWIDGQRCVLMIIRRQPGANILRDHRRRQGGAAPAEAVDLAGHRHDARAGPHRRPSARRCATSR